MPPNHERANHNDVAINFAGKTPEQFLRALGYSGDMRDVVALSKFRRQKAAHLHPDQGGNGTMMQVINQAVDNATGPKRNFVFDADGNLVQRVSSIPMHRDYENYDEGEILATFMTSVGLDMPDHAHQRLQRIIILGLHAVMKRIDGIPEMRSMIFANFYKNNSDWHQFFELIVRNQAHFPKLSQFINRLNSYTSLEASLEAILASIDVNAPDVALQGLEVILDCTLEQLKYFDQELSNKLHFTLFWWLYSKDAFVKNLAFKMVVFLAGCENILPKSYDLIMNYLTHRLRNKLIINGPEILEDFI